MSQPVEQDEAIRLTQTGTTIWLICFVSEIGGILAQGCRHLSARGD